MGKEDAVIDWEVYRKVHNDLGGGQETLFECTVTQSGVSYFIDDETVCVCKVPMDFAFTYVESLDGVPTEEVDCSGSSDLDRQMYRNNASKRRPMMGEPFSLLNQVFSCSKGDLNDFPTSLWTADIPVSQLVEEECLQMSQHTEKRRSNGFPVVSIYDEQATFVRNIHGCADDGGRCGCTL